MKFLVFLLFPLQLFSQETSMLIRNVNIVDVQTGKIWEDHDVLIRGNRIIKIEKKTIAESNVIIVQGKGKYLIPGLWDMHVHVFNNTSNRPPNEYYLPLLVANGVCNVRDMWTKPSSMNYVQQWRKEIDSIPGEVPRFVSAGTLVDGQPANWPNSDTVKNAEEARTMVRKVKAAGLDFFKVYSHLSREAYFAIADECKKLNFPFAGHVPDGITMAEASEAGQRSQEHVGYMAMFTELSDKEDTFNKIKLADMTPALRTELFQSLSDAKLAALAAVLVKNRTALCPTLTQYRGSMIADDTGIRDDDRLEYVDSFDRKDWAEYAGRFRPENRKLRQMRFEKGLEIVRKLHQNGVQILAGTDLGNPFVYAGLGLHDELALLVQAGLSPLAALQTATINPAEYSGRAREAGTVQEGKLADLVLLDANPLADISNTKKINAVIINGKLVTRDELDKLIELAKEKMKNL